MYCMLKRTNVIIIGDLNIDLIEDNTSSYHIIKFCFITAKT